MVAARRDLGGERMFAGTAEHQHRKSLRAKAPRHLRIGSRRPALRGTDGAGRERRNGAAIREPEALPPRRDLGRCDFQLGQRICGRQRRALGHGERRAAVDHAGQGPLAPAHIVEQAEPDLAGESGALGNAGEPRRERRFPGARHHQCAAITFGAQARRERAMLGDGEPLARQVPHDALAHPRHVVEQRRHHGGGQHVDWAAGDEIADPHVGNEQDGRRVASLTPGRRHEAIRVAHWCGAVQSAGPLPVTPMPRIS